MPNLPLRKRDPKLGRQADGAPLKPKSLVLGLSKARPNEFQPSPDELNSALRQAAEETGAAGAAIAVGSGNDLYCRASTGMAPPPGARLDPQAGFSGLCFRTGEPLLCGDAEDDSRVDRDACRSLGVRSALVVPLRKAGASCGILELFSPEPATFSERHLEVVRAIADRLTGSAPEPQPQAAPEKTSGPSFEHAIMASVKERLAWAKHSLWSRTTIAAALIAAGVIGYGGKLKHLEPAKPPNFGNLQSGLARSSPAPIVAASVAQTEARIQGTFSGSDLNPVRARAAAGDARAAYDLGERYADGAGVAQDYQEAMKWLARAAAKGDASAQWKLGLGYLKGIGVPQDSGKAAAWFLQAANQAHIGAQRALSELYLSGRGVPRDSVRAYTWATIAAQTTNGNPDSLKEMAAAMTPAQLAEAKRRIAVWWQHRARPINR